MAMRENTFVMPSSWLRAIRPRRGGVPVEFSPATTWAADVATLVAKRPSLRTSLTDPQTPTDIREAGLAHLDGGGTPLGAAAVVAAYVGPPDEFSRSAAAVFADGWVAGHGLRFAVEAAMELQGLGYGARWDSSSSAGEPVVRRVRGTEGAGAVLTRVRAAVAAAPEEDYRSLVDLLGHWRERTATHRIVAAYLAPSEAAWVEEEMGGHFGGDDWRILLMLASVTTVEHAETLVGGHPPWGLLTDAGLLHTIVDGLGVAAAPMLVRWLDRFASSADARRSLLPVIAAMPTDEAFQALVERVDGRHVPAALSEASDRFPRRAVRLLASAASRRSIAERLRTHVAAHRDAAAEVLPALSGAAGTRAAAARVAAVLAELDRRVVAPPKALPPLLVTPRGPPRAGPPANRSSSRGCAAPTSPPWPGSPGSRRSGSTGPAAPASGAGCARTGPRSPGTSTRAPAPGSTPSASSCTPRSTSPGRLPPAGAPTGPGTSSAGHRRSSRGSGSWSCP
ncbi:hypothetical protein OHA72_59865 [Dactylosporangium sp. NBC_01737]|uniref:hypothetical protein n=1 Tax=Dactylosporangium sp. NBC_01737 TaxID=2975959 RepID=UPI002E14E06A|nr:hypothetical protein OHA72_59865 [Dactylosporangium sp. NBC_01737]